MVKLLLRLCGIERMSRDAILMDYLPIPEPEVVALESDGTVVTPAKRRGVKLAMARERLGRPFKCAARNQDREVVVSPGVVAVVGAGLNRQASMARIIVEEASTFERAAWDRLKPPEPVVAIESRRRR